MILFSILSLISTAYSTLYAVHSFRAQRVLSAIGAIFLALTCLALSVLMLCLLRY